MTRPGGRVNSAIRSGSTSTSVSGSPLSRMVIKWETAFAAEYSIQASDDASSWVEIRHQFSSGRNRVAHWSHGFGTLRPGPRSPPRDTVGLLDIQPRGVRHAGVRNRRPQTSRSIGRHPRRAASRLRSARRLRFDGRMDTRFSSGFSDAEWIQVDLGQVVDISRVVLKWEAAFGAEYQIQARETQTGTWRVLANITNGDGGTDDLTGLSGTGRYVRMFGVRRGTPWGYSLWEFEVYGTPSTVRIQALRTS